ncbi:unnamed protein product, partial [Rotaria sp. Silwood2]
MKLSLEEAQAHPTRASNNEARASNNKSLEIVHDKKLTFCLETYVQWFNRLTSFVTTEIVKHTQKRLRIRLISYFIDAAYECFCLHNFNSMFGIIVIYSVEYAFLSIRALEEAQAHPTRASNNEARASNNKSLEIVHDKKLTFCLE